MTEQDGGENLYNNQKALEHLQKRWNRPDFTANAFRQYLFRNKNKYHAAFEGLREKGWTKEQLDNMEEPKRRGRPKSTKKKKDGALNKDSEAPKNCVKFSQRKMQYNQDFYSNARSCHKQETRKAA